MEPKEPTYEDYARYAEVLALYRAYRARKKRRLSGRPKHKQRRYVGLPARALINRVPPRRKWMW